MRSKGSIFLTWGRKGKSIKAFVKFGVQMGIGRVQCMKAACFCCCQKRQLINVNLKEYSGSYFPTALGKVNFSVYLIVDAFPVLICNSFFFSTFMRTFLHRPWTEGENAKISCCVFLGFTLKVFCQILIYSSWNSMIACIQGKKNAQRNWF